MSKEKKTQIIERLQKAFSQCTIAILTDYRGLTTAEMTRLRRQLQESGGEYKVVKNTLARLAAGEASKEYPAGFFEGPTAIALGYDDITIPAKVLDSYIKESKIDLKIKGGFFGDRPLTPEEVISLATLPSREILLAQALGQMKNPISTLLSYLTTPIRGIIGGLQARIKQLEGE